MIKNIKEACSYLNTFIDNKGKKDSLDTIIKLCSLFDNPHLNKKYIHITGTNGKGSTIEYIKNILLDAKISVSTFTSPHIIFFNERFTFNNDFISDDLLINIINKIESKIIKHNIKPTYFEICTLIYFLFINEVNSEINIIEVGIGGKYDSTNIITDSIPVITSVSMDHTNFLGESLESIFKNKIGIVKSNFVITNIDKIFQNKLSSKKVEISNINPTDIMLVDSLTRFKYYNEQYYLNINNDINIKNASLAIEVVQKLNSKYRFKINNNNIQNGFNNINLYGRTTIFDNYILDVAHNNNSLEVLVKYLEKNYLLKDLVLCFSCLQSKLETINFSFFDKFKKVFIIENSNPKSIKSTTLINTKTKISYIKQFNQLPSNDIVVITGSFYLISDFTKYYYEKNKRYPVLFKTKRKST